MENQQQNGDTNSKMKIWLKRVGIVGLLFFTLKGIAWLFIFAVVGHHYFALQLCSKSFHGHSANASFLLRRGI